MKKLILIIVIFCALPTYAQNYLISFTGTGASSTVSTVKVENLTSSTTLSLNGDDILRLTLTTGINPDKIGKSNEIKIYPNPMSDNSILEICPPIAGDATISIYDITGKQVAHVHDYLENTIQEYKLTGFKIGIYIINIKSNAYQLSDKLLSNSNAEGIIKIEKSDLISNVLDEKSLKTDKKGAQATFDMAYTTGDILRFTGASGTYRTVIKDIPTSDKTITFSFITCIDGDNNSYPQVAIGDQVWIAVNLKTTKYKDGITPIPTTVDNFQWPNLVTGGYCWYLNDQSTYGNTYGALYNWYALNTGNLCPTGWHIPAEIADLGVLNAYLGDQSDMGGKLKETGTTHWISPNTGATNEVGFTALPGGWRSESGLYEKIGYTGYFWSSTECFGTKAYTLVMYHNDDRVDMMAEYLKEFGFSVRCVRD